MPNREGEPWHDGFGPLEKSACYPHDVWKVWNPD
jgi:hypothetical protein